MEIRIIAQIVLMVSIARKMLERQFLAQMALMNNAEIMARTVLMERQVWRSGAGSGTSSTKEDLGAVALVLWYN